MSTLSKVLIIKLGYSETLVNDIGVTTSLGDVLRSTVILPYFKDDNVTWLTDETAIPLLKGNPLIDRILPFNFTTCYQIQAERFDTILNLEKIPGVCAFADKIVGWRRNGFRYEEGEIKAYDGSHHILEVCGTDKGKYWESFLFEMIGSTWKGERPTLGYVPTNRADTDIGLNTHVGDKWPDKAWPQCGWEAINQWGSNYTMSWQKGLDSMEEYIKWINSCRLIVTCDSLGLHIAHALGKKIVALFGPTKAEEIYIKDGIKLQGKTMSDITPEQVKEAIHTLLDKPKYTTESSNRIMNETSVKYSKALDALK